MQYFEKMIYYLIFFLQLFILDFLRTYNINANLSKIFVTVVNSMQIKHFFVPDTANLKSSDWIKLECNLEVNDTERRQVVIQWFLNDNTLLYQWSENRSTRQPYINLNFVDPVSLSLTKINGSVIEAPIKISHKTIHHSGLYKCNAFSFINETADEDEMQMYGKSKNTRNNISTSICSRIVIILKIRLALVQMQLRFIFRWYETFLTQ